MISRIIIDQTGKRERTRLMDEQKEKKNIQTNRNNRTVAGLYEVERRIGSGGGGIVFQGRHLRLNKAVVLKADKRKLSVGEDKLRREVDLLKGLSHTYIPQVYDFVQQGNAVFTVMDLIEGESLDKPLARKTLGISIVYFRGIISKSDPQKV